jgi:metallo-beta-lactamase class B
MRAHVPGEPAGTLRNVVFVGGMSLWADYKLVPVGDKATSYPGIAEDFERTFRTLKGLPCEVFLGAHGSYFGMLAKLERMAKEGDEVWVDPAGYQAAVETAREAFEKELARQKAAAR